MRFDRDPQRSSSCSGFGVAGAQPADGAAEPTRRFRPSLAHTRTVQFVRFIIAWTQYKPHGLRLLAALDRPPSSCPLHNISTYLRSVVIPRRINIGANPPFQTFTPPAPPSPIYHAAGCVAPHPRYLAWCVSLSLSRHRSLSSPHRFPLQRTPARRAFATVGLHDAPDLLHPIVRRKVERGAQRSADDLCEARPDVT